MQFAPEGAFGDQGITRGVMIGVSQSSGGDLESASDMYLNEMLQTNSYLRQRGGFVETTVGGRQGLTTSALGRSPVTGRTEVVTIYTSQFRNGELFYAVTVAPDTETASYNRAFRSVLSSIRFND